MGKKTNKGIKAAKCRQTHLGVQKTTTSSVFADASSEEFARRLLLVWEVSIFEHPVTAKMLVAARQRNLPEPKKKERNGQRQKGYGRTNDECEVTGFGVRSCCAICSSSFAALTYVALALTSTR